MRNIIIKGTRRYIHFLVIGIGVLILVSSGAPLKAQTLKAISAPPGGGGGGDTKAQVPEAFSYQAIARKQPGGQLIKNTDVVFRMTLKDQDGQTLYQEKHTITTDNYGVANLEIGRGNALTGKFGDVEWKKGNIYLNVEIDDDANDGSSNFVDMGASELLSVPYALQCKQCGSGANYKEFGVNVTDEQFGGPNKTTGDWTEAFQNALDYLAKASSTNNPTGGILFIPRGRYLISGVLSLETEHPDHQTSITIQGEGMHSSIIDFRGIGSGLQILEGVMVRLRDFHITGSVENNINFRNGGVSHAEISNVRSSKAVGSGIVFEGIIASTMKDVFSTNNGENGFEFRGYSTSINSIACYANNNDGNGWVINGMTYSTFTSCASDGNGRAGWQIANVRAVQLIGCGAESNSQAGFFVRNDVASKRVIKYEINGLSMESCLGVSNNLEGGFSNFLYVKSFGDNKARVRLSNCGDVGSGGAGDFSVVAKGKGAIIIDEYGEYVKRVIGVDCGVVRRVQWKDFEDEDCNP